MAKRFMVALGLMLLLTAHSAAAASSSDAATTQLSRAKLGIETLQGWYNQSTGLYDTTGWWNSANALTVLVDYARVSKSGQYDDVLANTFKAAPKTYAGFLNKFYDDEGWWALAWIDAYDLTKDRRYLETAESIFEDMAGGWDSTCGGGIWWSKDRGYKNAIANELFLSVSAHLANRDAAKSAQYLDWANREWKWFAGSGMINAAGLINDGLAIQRDHSAATTCRNNEKTTWSYNQGVVLGGLSELSKLNHDDSIPQAAQQVAMAAISHLTDAKGVMHDPCEPKCGADGVQFKGIFVRNLLALNASAPKPQYREFIIANANSIWVRARGPKNEFGEVWSGPLGATSAASQSSALDAIVSAASLEKGN